MIYCLDNKQVYFSENERFEMCEVSGALGVPDVVGGEAKEAGQGPEQGLVVRHVGRQHPVQLHVLGEAVTAENGGDGAGRHDPPRDLGQLGHCQSAAKLMVFTWKGNEE